MAIRAKDIYEGRKKSRFHLGVIITVLLALIVAAVLLFYGVRQYAVYDDSGNATIVWPWVKDEAVPDTSASPSQSAQPSPSESPLQSPNVT
ncbi:MAG: hypothetical protein EOM51_01220 [Clostridia bacterium]|nr:hypothetical protein [Clostridia bacterium]